ncbi:putative O-methyltransferase YrrM [Planomicrobium soli]|uniref:Putative O-methyltransferase YrrM n=1 Tax=Planomicrobium soli TaxID=1176648 RepID=A0A2P8H4T9_9BACL|nr:O-methyltransferase [Planomicrobium soli]PSL41246.1 putative O-methyltransferase YrrM [Planomicrobium soli]
MTNEHITTTLQLVKAYAEQHHVPIMEDQGIEFLLQLLLEQKPKSMLEIGAAIGFSAIKVAEALPDCKIDTIERDDERFDKAVEFIGEAGLDQQIRVFHADALEFELKELNPSYDAIFIDAAKGQYDRFFEKYGPLLADEGILYCDNMKMHGMVEQEISEVPRRKRTMIRNIKQFKEKMMDHPDYDTRLLTAGDGIMVCKKKKA